MKTAACFCVLAFLCSMSFGCPSRQVAVQNFDKEKMEVAVKEGIMSEKNYQQLQNIKGHAKSTKTVAKSDLVWLANLLKNTRDDEHSKSLIGSEVSDVLTAVKNDDWLENRDLYNIAVALAALDDKSGFNKSDAAYLLAKTKNSSALTLLKELSRDQRPRVNKAASVALSRATSS